MRFFGTLLVMLLFMGAGTSGITAVVAGGVSGENDYESLADSQPGEEQFLKNSRQLIYQGNRAGEGYFSEDGKLMIFQSEREPGNPFFQIYVLDFETGETHRVSPGIGKTTCSFFRPGTDEVIFASTHLDAEALSKQEAEIELRKTGQKKRHAWDYDEHYDIFSSRRDGSELKRLTETHGYDAEGAYSPDGNKIVFCSTRDAYPIDELSEDDRAQSEQDISYFGEIYIMNADGSDERRLTNWPGYDGGPFFTPDGKRIVWRHFDESGMLADVYTMRLDGSDRRRLTDFDAMSWAPYFHPSNRYVIFASNKLGFSNFELFIVDALGTKQPVRVTFTDGFDGLPVFSPDGRRLSWTSTRGTGKGGQLFIADWNHEAALSALEDAPARPGSGNETFGLSPEIKVTDLRAQVGFLASDELEGRMTGSEGTRLAAEYLADYLGRNGIEPLGDSGTYFQEFPFTSGMKVLDDQCALEVFTDAYGEKRIEFTVHEDFRPLTLSSTGTVKGDVVFAGYGLSVPGDLETGYDSYANIDVTDKIVLVLRFVPEGVGMERRQELNHYAGLRHKAMIARERGAKALLVVTGPTSDGAGEVLPLKYDRSSSDSGIPVASVSGRVAESLFAESGKNLEEVQSKLDVETPHFAGSFELPGTSVRFATAVEREKKRDRNVVGVLPPNEGIDGAEFILIGAHYDHIGRGEIGSLADKDQQGEIHNGADDNASGTSVVMELAAAISEEWQSNRQAFRRGAVFAFWSGEELGIVGSSYFAEHPPVPLENIVAYVNFDMVGRLKDNTLTLQGVGSSSAWTGLFEKRNVAAGFNLILQSDPYLPTDAITFYQKGIPVVSFFTGVHEDYNKPSDDPETLDYDGIVRIAELARPVVKDLIIRPERPVYAEVEKPKGQRNGHGEARAYMGTIPDFAAADVEGVKLSGVRAGGPADQGGVRGGDIIVEFAGQKITNIYDYQFALGGVKIGEPVTLVVMRDGEKVTLTVVPGSRE